MKTIYLVRLALTIVSLFFALTVSISGLAETPPPAPFMSSGVMLGGPCETVRDSLLPMSVSASVSNLFSPFALSIGPGMNPLLGESTSVGGVSLLGLRAANSLVQAISNLPGGSTDLDAVENSIANFTADSAQCETMESWVQSAFIVNSVPIPTADVISLQQLSGEPAVIWRYGSPAPNALSPYDLQVQSLLLSQYQTLIALYEGAATTASLSDVEWLGDQLHRFFADQLQLSVGCRLSAAQGQIDESCLPTLDSNGQTFASFLATAVNGMAPAVESYVEASNSWQGYLVSLKNGLIWIQANLPQYQAALQWWQGYLAGLGQQAQNAQNQASANNGEATYWYYKALERANQHDWGAMKADLDKFEYYEWWVGYWLGELNYFVSLEPQAVSTIQAYQAAIQQFQADQQQWAQLVPKGYIIIDTLAQGIKSLSYEFANDLTPLQATGIEERLAANDPSILDETSIINQVSCVYSTINQYLNPNGQPIGCRYNP